MANQKFVCLPLKKFENNVNICEIFAYKLEQSFSKNNVIDSLYIDCAAYIFIYSFMHIYL